MHQMLQEQKLVIGKLDIEKQRLEREKELLNERVLEKEKLEEQFKQRENELLGICKNFDAKLKALNEKMKKQEENLQTTEKMKEESESET